MFSAGCLEGIINSKKFKKNTKPWKSSIVCARDHVAKIEVIWRWWKNSPFINNWLKLPNGPSGMRAFFRPPPNQLNFGTHDLLHKKC